MLSIYLRYILSDNSLLINILIKTLTKNSYNENYKIIKRKFFFKKMYTLLTAYSRIRQFPPYHSGGRIIIELLSLVYFCILIADIKYSINTVNFGIYISDFDHVVIASDCHRRPAAGALRTNSDKIIRKYCIN